MGRGEGAKKRGEGLGNFPMERTEIFVNQKKKSKQKKNNRQKKKNEEQFIKEKTWLSPFH